ncbi:hypothetical protein [Alicyclobacillus fastidiosus]|uniref:Uncharacterized protein n=2 Tax=Alicyclobacillus fastidiosus TaxID=392011 RepID=A0ABY6ZJW1_9BACL|nr:hypothetical protein [Alicyclobacillus fastidiosus]WAH43215.1 hypothetical protein NZD89_07405 [Alicyclobacillus fastidiosus]WEH10765.1 hypothetical protein PYS47_05950 [Alicyclobacillus fastidiosus]GMA65248.1 hypothetical protein GCM10025859_56880 [Alicyclobacillus fastidiosus]
MSKKHPEPTHNDANKTLPIEEHEERIQGETKRAKQGKPNK